MKALLVAGGTGGHLAPALGLAHTLQRQGRCLLLSTSREPDRQLAQGSSLEWIHVDLKPFTPLVRWLSFPYAFRQLRAVREITSVIRREKPDVVVGFGGYLSAIGILAARLSRFPTVIHEQNLLPGKANRVFSRWCNAVAVSFPETKGYLPRKARVEVTGNPLRPGLKPVGQEQARAFFRLDGHRPVLLIMGGSQGSHAINELALSMWEARPKKIRQALQVIHLVGSADLPLAEEAYSRWGMQARVFSFFKEIHLAFQAANLAIARAGATTIAEMVSFQLPAILIPYPYAGGHQRANAHWMEEAGGAVVLQQEGLDPESLWKEVASLMGSPERLERMRENLGAQHNGSATESLSALVQKVATP